MSLYLEKGQFLKWLFAFLTFGLFFGISNIGFALSKKVKNKPVERNENVVKTIIGLYGQPRIISERWINNQDDFIALEYSTGERANFIQEGELKGTLKNRTIVSIKIQEDFFIRNPGMIRDHLQALKHRSERVSFSKDDFKREFELTSQYRQWLAKHETNFQKKMRRDINERLDTIMGEELSSAEISIINKLKEKLEPQVRFRLRYQIEQNIKKKFSNRSAKDIDREISRKVSKDLNKMVKDEMGEVIFNKQVDEITEWDDALVLIQRVVSRHKPRISAEIFFDYSLLKSKRLEAMKKRFTEEGVVWSYEEKSLWDKANTWLNEKLDN